MPGGDVRRRGGGELGGDLLNIPLFGKFSKEGMLLELLVKTPAKTVDKKEEHGFVFLSFKDILNALGQIGESAWVVTGFEEGWVYRFIRFSKVKRFNTNSTNGANYTKLFLYNVDILFFILKLGFTFLVLKEIQGINLDSCDFSSNLAPEILMSKQ